MDASKSSVTPPWIIIWIEMFVAIMIHDMGGGITDLSSLWFVDTQLYAGDVRATCPSLTHSSPGLKQSPPPIILSTLTLLKLVQFEERHGILYYSTSIIIFEAYLVHPSECSSTSLSLLWIVLQKSAQCTENTHY